MADSEVVAGTDFSFPKQRSMHRGKVRDIYDFGDSLMLIATDRYSAFDRNLAFVPHKGEVSTAASRWWFDKTKSIIPNHVIGYPDPNVTWCKKYTVVPIEMVVRGYITGVTSTSLWHTYSQSQRDYGEFTLPDGLHKNQKLPEPVLTPTTKFEKHDRNLTPEEAVKEGLITKELWQQLKSTTLELFKFGQKTAEAKGLILVDTKYEFGQDEAGNIFLIDEIHSPDSSRYWRADTYEQRINAGQEPDYYDKEFLRMWYKERFDPYKDKNPPTPPEDVLRELSNRYAYVYKCLTGHDFTPSKTTDPLARIESNILGALKSNHA